MADDLGNRGKQGRDQINVNKPHEVTYWTKALGCLYVSGRTSAVEFDRR